MVAGVPLLGTTVSSYSCSGRQHHRALGVPGGAETHRRLPAAKVLITQALQLRPSTPLPSTISWLALYSAPLCRKYLEQLAPKWLSLLSTPLITRSFKHTHKNPMKHCQPPSASITNGFISSQPILFRFLPPSTAIKHRLPHDLEVNFL